MNEYTVLKPFERYNVGDTVFLNTRQAKYLLLNGSIRLVVPEPVVETPKKQTKGE